MNRDQSESESRKRHINETEPEGRTRTSRFPTHNSPNTSARQTPTQDQQNKAELSVSDLLLGSLSPRLAARHRLTSYLPRSPDRPYNPDHVLSIQTPTSGPI